MSAGSVGLQPAPASSLPGNSERATTQRRSCVDPLWRRPATENRRESQAALPLAGPATLTSAAARNVQCKEDDVNQSVDVVLFCLMLGGGGGIRTLGGATNPTIA